MGPHDWLTAGAALIGCGPAAVAVLWWCTSGMRTDDEEQD